MLSCAKEPKVVHPAICCGQGNYYQYSNDTFSYVEKPLPSHAVTRPRWFYKDSLFTVVLVLI